MPIIRRSRKVADERPQRPIKSIIPPRPPAPGEPTAERGGRIPPTRLVLSAIGLLIGIAASFFVPDVLATLSGSSHAGESRPEAKTPPGPPAARPLSEADLALELGRFVRIASMAVLAKREFEVNTVSHIEAENVGGAATRQALEIIADKNRADLARYKEQLGEILMSLYLASRADGAAVQRAFEAAAGGASDKDQQDIVGLLKLGARAMAQPVPANVPLPAHFVTVIDNTF